MGFPIKFDTIKSGRSLVYIYWEVTGELVHEISSNVVCATSKASDQPVHMRCLIRAFAIRLSILWLLSIWLTPLGVSNLKRRLQRLVGVYTCQNATLLEITCTGSGYNFQNIFYFLILKMQTLMKFHLGLHCLPKYPFRGFGSSKG